MNDGSKRLARQGNALCNFLTLHRLSQVVSSPLPLDDTLIDLSSGDVVVSVQRHIQEPLVVAEVKVHLTTIVQDKNLACGANRNAVNQIKCSTKNKQNTKAVKTMYNFQGFPKLVKSCI